MILRVSLAFADGSDHMVEETATAVHTKLYGNGAYPDPPVTAVILQQAADLFTAALGQAAHGSEQDTAHKDNMRANLVTHLRILASFVQQKHNNNLETLLSSGFDAVSTNRAQHPLETPGIKKIKNGVSGQLILVATPVKNSKALRVRYAPQAADGTQGPWQDGGLFTDSRNIPISNLTPGQRYTFQLCAIGGSTGCSDWSDPSSHMSL